jgi:tRNA(adenine34) deaminase
MVAPLRYAGLLVMNTMLATGDAPLSSGFLAWRSLCAKETNFDVGRLLARGNPHLSPEECAAYNAPFPDAGHRAALKAFPKMVPDHQDAPGAAVSLQAKQFWAQEWQGQTLMAVGAQDPVFGLDAMQKLRLQLGSCPAPMVLEAAGHFVQEHGQSVAEAALTVFKH